jgi:hypothetical protein
MSTTENVQSYRNRSSKFCLDIGNAINLNDMNAIKNIIASKSYTDLTLEEKESQAFISAYTLLNTEVLTYLIFDYQIKEKYFIQTCTNIGYSAKQILGVDEFENEVKQMFEKRNLKLELTKDLDNGNTTSEKRTKI